MDAREPEHVAQAVKQLGLKHVVVTSVTRDDLPDGGAEHFARVIKAVRAKCPQTTIEVLIPDFQGSLEALNTVIAAKPTVINHNIETIRRLYPQIRPMADYDRSLELLRRVKDADPGLKTKSGIMVGFGEAYGEVLKVLRDLRAVGCDFLTIGQYLAPSGRHHPVVGVCPSGCFQQIQRGCRGARVFLYGVRPVCPQLIPCGGSAADMSRFACQGPAHWSRALTYGFIRRLFRRHIPSPAAETGY